MTNDHGLTDWSDQRRMTNDHSPNDAHIARCAAERCIVEVSANQSNCVLLRLKPLLPPPIASLE